MNRDVLLLVGVLIFLFSCNKKTITNTTSQTNSVHVVLEVPDTIVNKSDLFYNTKKSLWTLNDTLYSGYAVNYYSDNTLKEKFGILNGKKHALSIQWFLDGHYQHLANYQNGKLHGDKKTWSQDSLHTLVSHFQYVSGKPHGEQKKWYPTGELFKKMNLNMGKEEGLQQAFRKNGVLYTNYEAREGRIFGLKKTALCFSLEDENIQQK